MKLPIHQYIPDASQLILGCMHFGGAWDDTPVASADIKQALNVVTKAVELGINVIDLADIYTYGKAEQTFGELFKRERSLRNHLILQSKVGIKLTPAHPLCHYDLSGDWISKAVNDSIKRLHDNNLDILFLHRPDPLMQLEDTANALNKLYEQGKFEYLAVSNMHAGQIAYLQSALPMPIIANQLEMSLASYDFVEDGITTNMKINANNGFPRGTLEYCQQAGVQLQAWGAVAQGRFAGAQPLSCEKMIATQQLLEQLAAEYQVDVNAIVVAWLLRHPANIQPVIGTTNPERLESINKALSVSLTKLQWYHLFETVRGERVP